jgi:CheY-like chemotaxis protein
MGHKLLLADDSVTIQRVIELTFADEDIQVIAVGDGQQAIAKIETERPDVVLADIGMPERDGYEVAAHVKGAAHLSHIPVLLLTGAFEPIDEARARAVGCDGVLVKPFEPQMVINRVRDLLAGRRPSSLWAPTSAPAGAPASGHSARGRTGDSADMSEPHRPEQPEVPRSPESLDDYFDRLDAAFTDEHARPPAAAAQGPAEQPARDLGADFGSWDIGSHEPARNEPDTVREVSRPAPAPGPAAPPSTPVAEPPPLADAFAALLAAEQRVAPAAPAAPAITEEVVEDIVRRVIARMTDDAVRATVLDVAERLVREEIERIKNQG